MICRHLIVVPVYNNPQTVMKVIKACLEVSNLPILVVDDGSDQEVQLLAKDLVSNKNLFFLRHNKNHGKGVALQSAISWCLKKAYTHMITIDADDQHDPADLPQLLKSSLAHPWALIVGDRNMNTDHVPKSSTFGKAFSNFWIRYETNAEVSDSQSGYRVYPIYHLQTMSFHRKHYDFEIEVLTRLLWKKVEVINVPVKVKYFSAETRVSHFDKLKDNFRISVTNMILVSLSLIKNKDSLLKHAVAFGFGVLVGTTPFYGLHTLIVVILALFLRLNLVYLWLGTQISLPPMIPFLVLGTNTVRGILLPHQESDMLTLSFGWVLSSMVLGLLLAVPSAAGFYILGCLNNFKKNEHSQQHWVRTKKPHLGISIMKFVLKKFGRAPAYFLLNFIVPFYFVFQIPARLTMSEFWKIVRPELNLWQRQLCYLKHIMAFSKQLVDRAYQAQFSDPIYRFEYLMHHPKTFHKAHAGTILVSGHFGGWDLVASAFAQDNEGKKMRAIVFGNQSNFNNLAQNQNQNYTSTFFNQEDFSIMKIKADLQAGQAVGLMADRPVGKNYELMPFFGKIALFDSTAFRIAQTCQSQLCYIFAFKQGYSDYILDVYQENSVPLSTNGRRLSFEEKEKLIYQQMLGYVSKLEKKIQENPEQWYNFLPFWSQPVKN